MFELFAFLCFAVSQCFFDLWFWALLLNEKETKIILGLGSGLSFCLFVFNEKEIRTAVFTDLHACL